MKKKLNWWGLSWVLLMIWSSFLSYLLNSSYGHNRALIEYTQKLEEHVELQDEFIAEQEEIIEACQNEFEKRSNISNKIFEV